MRHKIPPGLKRETFTGRLAPDTARFLKMVPGSNGRKIDYLVSFIKPMAESQASSRLLHQIHENITNAANETAVPD